MPGTTTSPKGASGKKGRLSPSMPERGEVWLAGLDPVGPGEQGGTRPVLVVSTNAFNAWPVRLAIVVPITTRDRASPTTSLSPEVDSTGARSPCPNT